MLHDWPDCPYCGEALESEMLYAEVGPKLAYFCTCEGFKDIEDQLYEDIINSLKDE
jgi:hypothetical protein